MMTQSIVAAKTTKIHASLVDELLALVDHAVDEQIPMHEVERCQESCE